MFNDPEKPFSNDMYPGIRRGEGYDPYMKKGSELRAGATDGLVAKVQIALAQLGYPVNVTGTLDPKTWHEVFAFQKNVGLQADGHITPNLLSALDDALGLNVVSSTQPSGVGADSPDLPSGPLPAAARVSGSQGVVLRQDITLPMWGE